jgi:hypothetical protein
VDRDAVGRLRDIPGAAIPLTPRLSIRERVRFGLRQALYLAEHGVRERTARADGSHLRMTLTLVLAMFLLYLRLGGEGWGWLAALALLLNLDEEVNRRKRRGRRMRWSTWRFI